MGDTGVVNSGIEYMGVGDTGTAVKERPSTKSILRVPLEQVIKQVQIEKGTLYQNIKTGKIKDATANEGIPKGLFNDLIRQTTEYGGIENLILYDEGEKILGKKGRHFNSIVERGIIMDNPDLSGYQFLKYEGGKLRLKEKAPLKYVILAKYSNIGRAYKIGSKLLRKDAIEELRNFLEINDPKPIPKVKMKTEKNDDKGASDKWRDYFLNVEPIYTDDLSSYSACSATVRVFFPDGQMGASNGNKPRLSGRDAFLHPKSFGFDVQWHHWGIVSKNANSSNSRSYTLKQGDIIGVPQKGKLGYVQRRVVLSKKP